MRLSEISIRRPVLAVMMSLGLVLFGLICLPQLGVREFPNVNAPVVNVTTVYSGASAEVVETQITNPLEETLNSIEGVKAVSSESRDQFSTIKVVFNLSRNIDIAAQDARDRVARAMEDLPRNVKPTVTKQDADAQPTMWIVLYSDIYSTLELSTFAESIFKQHLQSIPGVSSIVFGGEKRFAVRLWLDPQKMSAKGTTVMDIENALKTQNVELPSGHIESLQREFSIETRGQLKTIQEYNELVVKQDGSKIVYLRDVGFAKAGVEDEKSIARFNSKPCVGIGIVKKSRSNRIEIAHRVINELERIKPNLPRGVNVSIPYDESIYIERSVNEVWITLGLAIVFVILTIFLFLGDIRLTIIPAATIPVCLIATFGVLYLFGFTINIVTMLAFVLAIGLVVDDSIIVMENIYRHIQQGMKPLSAALVGMKEIGFAVIATTLVLVVVFLPMVFQHSISGRLFIEFSIVISFSVLISAFVALTLSPMMAAYFLLPFQKSKDNRMNEPLDTPIHLIKIFYERTLNWSLQRPFFIIFSAIVVSLLTLFIYFNLEQDFLPDEDKGRFLCVVLSPQGSTSEYTDRMVRKMEKIISSTPEVEGYFTAVALAREGPGLSSQGLAFVRLKDKRQRNLGDILLGKSGLALKLYKNVEGAIVFPILPPPSISDAFTQPFELVLENQNLRELSRYANQLNDKLTASNFLEDVRTAFQLDNPKLNVIIDRKRAASLGVSVEDVSHTLQVLFDGLDLSLVNLGGEQYKVIAQLDRNNRLTPASLDRIYVQNTQGQLVPLSNLVHYQPGSGPNMINHYNRNRSATIEASPINASLGTVIKKTEQLIKKDLPKQFHYEWTGQAKDFIESGRDLFFVFGLSILVVYMVLASQFESLVDPFTILLTVPLAVFGAFGSLWFLNLFGIPGMGINLFSQIGLILLIGLVTKNGILLVEFANQQMAKGKDATEAMMISGLIRLRPILMTVFATIAGTLPIAIGFGIGGAGRRPLGIAVIGGILSSTFLTLFVIPTIYVLLNRFKRKISAKNVTDITKVLLLVITLSVLVSGCAMGPNYKRPSVEITNKWKISDPYWKEALPQDNIPKGNWWKVFKDPVLDNLEKQAISLNQDLKIAFETLNQARAVAGLQNDLFVPNFQSSPGYTNLDSYEYKYFKKTKNVKGFYSIPLNISYELDLWGRVRRSMESAKDQAQASEAAYQSVLLSLTADVAKNYFILKDLLTQDGRLRRIMKLNEQLLSLEKDRYKAGIVKMTDVKQRKEEFVAVESELVDITLNKMEIENALAILCGKMPSDFQVLFTSAKVSAPNVPPGLPSELLERRPDIAEAERLMASSNAMIGATKASFFPKITLIESVGFEGVKLRNLLDWKNEFSEFGPDIALPNLNINENKEAYRIALSKYDQAVANYRQKILVAFNEVEDALANVSLGRKKWEIQNQIVEQSQQTVKDVRLTYQKGVINYLEVLTAQRAVLLEELKTDEILNKRLVWTIQLIKALGGAWTN